MSIITGTIVKRVRKPNTLPTTQVVSPCDVLLCGICGGQRQWVTSVRAKVTTGYGHRWVEDKSVPPLALTIDGKLIEQFAMKKVSFPITATLDVCHRDACRKKCKEILPDTERGVLHLTERVPRTTRYNFEGGRGINRDYRPDELRADPTWMTSRGKHSRF